MATASHETAPELGPVLAVWAGAWVLLVAVCRRGWRQRRSGSGRFAAFVAGTAVSFAAVSPPVERLADDLVSAHMVQHVLLVLVAAPLVAVSRPLAALVPALSRRVRKRTGAWRRRLHLTPATTSRFLRPAVVWLAYALALWFWHGSTPYELASHHPAVHVLEHAVFLGAALAFWSVVLTGSGSGVSTGYRILMVFTTAFHSVLLGALLTFARSPWYPSYEATALARGIAPLTDQQLAGLLMWIPGTLVYTGAGLWLLMRWMRRAPLRVEAMRAGRRLTATGPRPRLRDPGAERGSGGGR